MWFFFFLFNDLNCFPSKVIKGSTVSPGIKSFGYSLSGGLDMDANGYPGTNVLLYAHFLGPVLSTILLLLLVLVAPCMRVTLNATATSGTAKI